MSILGFNDREVRAIALEISSNLMKFQARQRYFDFLVKQIDKYIFIEVANTRICYWIVIENVNQVAIDEQIEVLVEARIVITRDYGKTKVKRRTETAIA